MPLVSAQRCHRNGYRGFSPNPYLNNFFIELYGAEDEGTQRDVCHIDGSLNPVDGLSRNAPLCQKLVVEELPGVVVPDVRSLYHPQRATVVRHSYEV